MIYCFIMQKKNRDKIYLFESAPVPKAVLTLALPMVASCLVMMLYSLADTWFVGLLNDPLETAAVSLSAPVLLAFNAVNNLFGVGCGSMMSRALGLKEYETVRRTSAFGFWCAIGAGLLFSALTAILKAPLLSVLGATAENGALTSDYLFWTVICGAVPAILNVVTAQLVRAEGSALHAGIGTMSGCLLNIVLDPLFILPSGLGMGAAGAGLATFLSNCFACLYFFGFLFFRRRSTYVSVSPKRFGFDKRIMRETFGVGVPAAIQNLLNVTGMTVLNNMMSAYGSEALSAIGIAHKLALLLMYISQGISQGVMPLVGYNYAAKNGTRMREAIFFAGKISALVMIPCTVLMTVFAKPVMSFFMKNELIVFYGGSFLVAQTLAQPFLALDFLGVGVYQACGKGRISLLFAVMRKIVLEIPALLILNRLVPMYGLAWAQFSAEVILAGAALICLGRIIRGVEDKNERGKIYGDSAER